MTVDINNDNKLIEYALSSHEYIDQFIPIIKAELLDKNSLDNLIERLDSISVEKDKELQEISYDSLDDIVKSVNFVEEVINNTQILSKKVNRINKDLNKSGKLLLDDNLNYLKYKQTNQRLFETNTKINKCLDILNKTNLIIELIHTEDFYKSLILLKSLSNTFIPEIENFNFIKLIFNSISAFKLTIIEESFNNLNKWLNINIESNLTDIGEYLFDSFIKINNDWNNKIMNENLSLINFKVNSPVEKSFRNFNLNFLRFVNIDLKDLYQSILVFKELNQLNQLKEYLSNDSIRRIDHISTNIINSMNNNLSNESLKLKLYSIVSFSIIDKEIHKNSNYQLRSLSEINNTFEIILNKILPLLSKHIDNHSNDLPDLLELNDIIGLCYQILSNYKFNCNKIYNNLLIKIFKNYTSKLISNFKNDYSNLTLVDDNQSIILNNYTDLKNLSNDVFYISKIENPNFPIKIPFSKIYLNTCKLIKKFILDIYDFISIYYINDINLLITYISNSIDSILTDIILKNLNDNIHSTYKEVVSKNLINLDFYLSAIYEIEKFLNKSDNLTILKSRNFSNLIKLNSVSEFKKTKKSAIENMFNMIDGKIKSLFELVDFEWDSTIERNQPNTNLIDLIEFLKNSFKFNFSDLTESIKLSLLIKIFDQISKFLKDSILNYSTILTAESIFNFNLDIKFIESSISEFSIINNNLSNKDTIEELKTMFIKLNQIIDLLNDGNLNNYKIDEIRLRKFDKIKPEEAVKLINKLPIQYPITDDGDNSNINNYNGNDTFDINNSSYNNSEVINNDMDNSSLIDNSQDDNRSILSAFKFRKS